MPTRIRIPARSDLRSILVILLLGLLGAGFNVKRVAFRMGISEQAVLQVAVRKGCLPRYTPFHVGQLKIWPGFLLRRNWLRLAA